MSSAPSNRRWSATPARDGSTLDTLVTGLFDYAGMFPPAALGFEETLRTSAALRSTLRRPHLLNADMVVKREHLARMDDLTLADAGFDRDRPVHVALVGVPLQDGAVALDELRHLAQGGRKIPCRPVALEVTTDAALRPGDPTTEHDIAALAEQCHAAGATLYVEPQWNKPLWGTRLDDAMAALARVPRTVGLKVRCAGPTALGAATLARVVAAVHRAGVPLKATQGLHHPIAERTRYGNEIGFLGLTVALRLAHRALPDELEACIREDDAGAFRFDAEMMRWRDHTLTRAEIDKAQQERPFQIGSCSLHEPDDDLARLYD